MIYVGINVAKDKHDCFITNSNGEVLFNSFTISNKREGFETLFQRIESVSDDFRLVSSAVLTLQTRYLLMPECPLYLSIRTVR